MTTAAPAGQAAMPPALELAAAARGDTSPHPVTGRVVLDAGGRAAGEGYHAGPAAPGGTGVATLAGAHRRRIDDSTRIGPDPRVTATARDSAASGVPATTATGRGPAPSRREH